MTMDEIRTSDKEFLIPRDVAPVIGCDRYTVNVLAKENRLPFNFIMCGNRVRIPRAAFIAWMDGRTGTGN